MGKQFYFPKGATVDAAVAEDACCPRIEFAYEPATSERNAEYEDAIQKGNARDIERLMRLAIGRHVRRWNVVDDKGEPVDPADMKRLGFINPASLADVFDCIYRRNQGVLEPATEEEQAAAGAEAEAGLGNL